MLGITSIVALAAGAVGAQRTTSAADQAKDRVGSVATICGRVAAYQCRPAGAGASLLAMDQPFTASGVSVAIARGVRASFGAQFESRLVLRDLCVTGQVERERNGYVVRAEDPAQIQIEGGVPPAIFGADSFSTCDEGIQQPRLVREVTPQYTAAAMRAQIEGNVLLEAVVLLNGMVGDIRILHSLDSRHGLDEQALKALKDWRFRPGTLQGKPVPVIVTIAITFTPRGSNRD